MGHPANLEGMETAYIGMGANLPSPAGPPEATLARAAERLGELGRVAARSHLYSTEPVGYADQPRFVNAVVALETELEPRALLEGLLALEREFGRDRLTGIVNGPRTLDLDLLLFGDVLLNEPDLTVPHPRLLERAFVLVPLCEIAPELRDPRSGVRVAEWIQRLPPVSTGVVSKNVEIIESNFWRAGADDDPDSGHGGLCPGAGDVTR
jgi:2-amino-4-hydroxy-6-hydroxymethyldihydropteridine diphosphokinase